MRILFCSRWYPYPPDNGSKIRVFNLIKHLSAHYQVDLVSFTSDKLAAERLDAMRFYCRHVDAVLYQPFQPGRLRALLGFFSRQPRSVVDTHSVAMQNLVERIGGTRGIEAVVASQVDMAPYAMSLPGITKILEEVELTPIYEEFGRQNYLLRKLRRRLTWWKYSHYMANLLRRFDGCTVVSEGERERILQISPGYHPIEIVPNGVDVTYHTNGFGPAEADTLVYSGALTFYANFQAVKFFLRQIFPLIQAERPNVKLFITGKLDGVPIDQLPANDRVIFTGYLDDIRPRVARSWVNIVPLQLGGGTRLKILEALALGTPVVTTSKGMEGLDLIAGRDLLVADRPVDFAAAVLRLLQDPGLRETLSYNGRRAVEAKYDWQMIGQQFNDFIERVFSESRQKKLVRNV